MSKLRKVFFILLLAVVGVCVSIAVAACGDKSPDFVNPEEGGAFKGNYTVTVQSQGGLKLDGVKIDVKKDGEVKQQVISINGNISFTLTPDVYDLVIDEDALPEGYYVPYGSTFKTSADNGQVSITLNSAVIDEPTPAGKVYQLGDVMYDFSFTEVVAVPNGNSFTVGEGETYTLSEVLKVKKAVLINLWGTTCSACQLEFPAMQSAYTAYQDKIEIFALSSYLSVDTAERLADFKFANGNYTYTFPVALDWQDNTNRLYTHFSFGGAYPTSIIIDRYGVVAFIDSGANTSEASWRALFNKYTRDDYSQEGVINPSEPGEDEFIIYENVDPDIVAPDSAAIEQAVSGDGAKDKGLNYYFADDEQCWPWVIDTFNGDSVIKPSNEAVDKYTFSIIYFDVTLKAGDGVSFEYYTDTKSDDNILHFVMNGSPVDTFVQDSDGWQTYKGFYIANRTVTLQLQFIYTKTQKVSAETPVYVRNIDVYDASKDGDTVDLAYAVAENAEFNEATHTYDADLEYSAADNFYYYTYVDNTGATQRSILYVDIRNLTTWTEKHIGSNTFSVTLIEDGQEYIGTYQNTLYNISHYKLLNSDKTNYLYETGKYSIVMRYHYLQLFSPNGYVPVTEEMKNALIAFAEYAHNNGITKAGDEYYEDQWLEFCYYFRHHGEAGGSEHTCWTNVNPVKGYGFDFPFEATMGNNEVNIETALNMYSTPYEAGGGNKFQFTPTQSGVYLFASTHDESKENVGLDPAIIVYDKNFNEITWQDESSAVDRYFRRYQEQDKDEDGNLLFDDKGNPVMVDLVDIGGYDFYMYVELTAGETYYFTTTTAVPGTVASYSFDISYAGTYVRELCVASKGEWSYTESGEEYFIADITPALNQLDNKYYVLDKNYNYGSVIYINFFNFCFINTDDWYTLGDVINGGHFNFALEGEENCTDYMRNIYNQLLEGDPDDELYGLVEADTKLVNILNEMIRLHPGLGDDPSANAWLMFANYYAEYGTKN